ncbi:MAG: hypothetical protein ACOYMA_20430, partial [Bacteroidia bacterium]
MENIPSIIFDLLGKKPFDQLTEQENSLVLQFINKAEYEELRNATLLSNSFKINEEKLLTNDKSKDLLLNHFREKNKNVALMYKPIELWKVAASFLLIMGICYFYVTLKNFNVHTQYLSQIDTVYIDKIVPGEKIFDTIYFYKKPKIKGEKKQLKEEYYEPKITNSENIVIE